MQNFSEYNMWLAAENGMFLRPTSDEWRTTMTENLSMDWDKYFLRASEDCGLMVHRALILKLHRE